MLGMAVATIVPSIAAMNVASAIEAMTKGRAAGVTVLTIRSLNPTVRWKGMLLKGDLRCILPG
jgi:hypothetical protein